MRRALFFISCFIFGVLIYYAFEPKAAKASSDCPVMSETPDGNGGATVVFNCQAYIVTIDEPQWP